MAISISSKSWSYIIMLSKTIIIFKFALAKRISRKNLMCPTHACQDHSVTVLITTHACQDHSVTVLMTKMEFNAWDTGC